MEQPRDKLDYLDRVNGILAHGTCQVLNQGGRRKAGYPLGSGVPGGERVLITD